ncbi:hypothetical protein E2C01_053444 [Portunus trituberculatus]|uniref:Uncharacterized protein n=1 Tax=Portunus trituberculatus TaxID=210409 RepID=A0A5B7GPQ7_PORTR|nr:hypothetical protein [Portunus trituberculatus]
MLSVSKFSSAFASFSLPSPQCNVIRIRARIASLLLLILILDMTRLEALLISCPMMDRRGDCHAALPDHLAALTGLMNVLMLKKNEKMK